MSTQPTLYFGYGSNMWRDQMSLRCPSSPYVGVGRLASYRWNINTRGYANVLPSESPKDDVYGLLYALDSKDERALDANEGVLAGIYEKHTLDVTVWNGPAEEGLKAGPVDMTGQEGQVKKCLVYVDVKRTDDGRPKDEYVVRMNEAVRDACRMGVVENYLHDVIGKYIPLGSGKESDEVIDHARQQAESFRDEE